MDVPRGCQAVTVRVLHGCAAVVGGVPRTRAVLAVVGGLGRRRGGVEGVTFNNGEAMLTVNGRAVPLNTVQAIFEREAA